MSLLLLKSRPLVVIPELAVRVGLNEAMLLQQIQYWLTETTSGVEYDGSRWIYNTVEEWKNQFPFFSESTIKRAFTNLKNQGVLRIEQINKSNHDRTNYYAINYSHQLLTEEVSMTQSNSDNSSHRTVQNDLIDKRKLKPSNSSKCAVLNGSKWPDLTENTTEITSENTTETNSSCQVPAEPDNLPEKLILDYFNKVTNSKYREGKTTTGHIKARLEEGFTSEDLMLITDYLTAKWQSDSKMRDYLRPKTLFIPENCIEYQDKAIKWRDAGRPECVNGRWLKPGEVAVEINTVERDETFRKIFTSGWKPKNKIQELSAIQASKNGLGQMSDMSALAAWRGIWRQVAEQVAQEAQ